MFLLGILNSSITLMINKTSDIMYQTTQMSTEKVSSDGKALERPPVPYSILYMIITLVCIFVILFGLFVGIYFYKHCIKLKNITDDKGESHYNLNEGYKSLNQLDTNRSVNSLRDSTYLEPFFDARLHYDEIENQDELSATGIVRVSIKRLGLRAAIYLCMNMMKQLLIILNVIHVHTLYNFFVLKHKDI